MKHKKKNKSKSKAPKSPVVDVVPVVSVTRAPKVTRAQVEAEYEHPDPEVRGRLALPGDPVPASAKKLRALAGNAKFKTTTSYSRGTDLPKWRVNLPTSKPTPGPAIDAGQYFGDVMPCVVVRGHHATLGGFTAYYFDGRVDKVYMHAPGDSLRLGNYTELVRALNAGIVLRVKPRPAKATI